MKKILFLMTALGIVLAAHAGTPAGDSNETAASEQASYVTFRIEFQTNPAWDLGSTVTYQGPSGTVTQNLRVISNSFEVLSGTGVYVQLLVSSGERGLMKGYVTGYGEFYEADPVTGGFYFLADPSSETIIIRIESAE